MIKSRSELDQKVPAMLLASTILAALLAPHLEGAADDFAGRRPDLGAPRGSQQWQSQNRNRVL
jgi:hypothetical protein